MLRAHALCAPPPFQRFTQSKRPTCTGVFQARNPATNVRSAQHVPGCLKQEIPHATWAKPVKKLPVINQQRGDKSCVGKDVPELECLEPRPMVVLPSALHPPSSELLIDADSSPDTPPPSAPPPSTSPAGRLKSGLTFGPILGWQRQIRLSARANQTSFRGDR